MVISPIVLFVYNRLNETKKVISSLKNNYLAKESDLIIFSDGPKTNKDQLKVKTVRDFLETIDGFKSVKIIQSSKNKGLGESIITGVSEIISKYKKVIVLEDDLITSPNFLDFMNQGLSFYQDSEKIFSISGYTLDLPSLDHYDKDFYLGYRASSWGWGTWSSKWEKVDWEVSDYFEFKRSMSKQIKFMRGGSDLPQMLWQQMNGKIDSWAIRWCYEQYKEDLFTVFPAKSKVISIGFGEDATHTHNTNRFDTKLDNGRKRNFEFETESAISEILTKEFRKKFSIKSRFIDKLLGIYKK